MAHPTAPLRALVPILLLALVRPGDAQPPPDPTLEAHTDFVEVELVNVEVWVSRRGEPVEGLTAEDFVVREDGKPVEITHFAEVREERTLVSPGERANGGSDGERNAQAATAEPAPSHLVVYLDDLHLSAASRKRPIEDLRAFLRSDAVDPERVLILSQGRDLYTAAPFGSTRRELDRALEALQSEPGLGTSHAGDKRLALQRLQLLWKQAQENALGRNPCDLFVRQGRADVESQSRELARRAELTLEHLAGAVRFLAALEGVKTLVFLSDSLETRPAEDLLRFVESVCPLPDRAERWGLVTEDLSVQLHELTRHANANRVTIHTLQTLGLQPSFLGMAEQTTFDVRAGNPFELAHRTTEREGLAMLADETGGRAVFNRARLDEELETIAREMSSYYTLAYQPSHGGDGLLHRIDVDVKGGDYEVRHRRGYRDKGAEERLAEKLEGALYLGLVDNPLEVRLAAGGVGQPQDGRYGVTLHVLVPARHVAFLPQAEGRRAQLTVLVAVRHQDRPKLETIRRTVEVAESDPPAETVALSVTLELTPGLNVVGVAVRDDATRESSFVSTTLELPAVSPSRGRG